MCGITGFWTTRSPRALAPTVRSMADAIAHRGPDSSGEWTDDEVGIALGHRRLSILDLSPAGHQPMLSQGGRYVLCYNGEIYNHPALRAELEAWGVGGWRGHSDTETLLAAVETWGLDGALGRLNGMFALALWDRHDRVLHLARDRMGEKPLYYGRQGNTFLFGSELKALRRHPDFEGRIDRDVLTLLLRHNCVPGPFCIHEGLAKLPPAHVVTVSDGGRTVSAPRAYWSLGDAVAAGQAAPFAGTDAEAVEALESLLLDAVGLRMAADVPLGAFLSGGYDSTTVVAMMQAQSSRPVRTFSVGFEEADYNEADHARAVARHLGTDHTELVVRPADALAVIPDLPSIYDEPFSDSSQIPTYLVSRLARQHVTVALSGDGGDELFCGYRRYDLGNAVWSPIARLPGSVRRLLGRGLGLMPPGLVAAAIPRRLGLRDPAGKVTRLAEVLAEPSAVGFYRSLLSHDRDPGRMVLGAHEPRTVFDDPSAWPPVRDLRERMMNIDMATYLPDDILVKVDRASMAVGLEARVPLLDHRLVEFALSLPMTMKVRGGEGKWLLRRVLDRHVPQALMDRPKMGFGVPIEHWLAGPLRDWAEALLDPDRLSREGFFDPAPVRQLWQDHMEGGRTAHARLWDILMFQAWLEATRSDP